MNVAILDDTLDVVATLPSVVEFSKLERFRLRIWRDHTKDVDLLAHRLRYYRAQFQRVAGFERGEAMDAVNPQASAERPS